MTPDEQNALKATFGTDRTSATKMQKMALHYYETAAKHFTSESESISTNTIAVLSKRISDLGGDIETWSLPKMLESSLNTLSDANKARIDGYEMLDIFERLGDDCQDKNQHNDALNYYNKAKRHFDAMTAAGKAVKQKRLATIHYKIGISLQDLKRYDEAANVFIMAKDILEAMDAAGKLADRSDLADAYGSIAFCYGDSERYDEALKWHIKSRDVLTVLDDEGQLLDRRYKLAAVHYSISMLLHIKGSYNEELEQLTNAEKIYAALISVGKSSHLYDLGEVYFWIDALLLNQNRHSEALEYCIKAKDIFEACAAEKKLGDTEQLEQVYIRLADKFLAQKSYIEATKYYIKAMRHCIVRHVSKIQARNKHFVQQCSKTWQALIDRMR